MPLLKWILAGVIGGVVGAAIWAAIGYYTNHEVGYVAWAIGGLVGICVRVAAGDADGWVPGITAGVIAAAAVLLGKFLVVHFIVANALSGVTENIEITNDTMIAQIANEIVDERKAAGKPVALPAGVDPEEGLEVKDIPADIMKEATTRWNALTPEAQQKKIEETREKMDELMAMVGGAARDEAFKGSFGPFDLLWFALAAWTAFKLGSGMASDDS